MCLSVLARLSGRFFGLLLFLLGGSASCDRKSRLHYLIARRDKLLAKVLHVFEEPVRLPFQELDEACER